jgi:diaminopimelate epimerase
MIRFTKMSGSGNDFIVLDNRKPILSEDEIPAFARRVCPRGTAVGADGVLLMETSAEADFRMRVINPDGGEAEMCGNGARCIAAFAQREGVAGKKMSIETLGGLVHAEMTPRGVKVGLADTPLPEMIEELEFGKEEGPSWFVVTGVPHAVVVSENLDAVPVREWGRAIRMHSRFQPAGTNADFIARSEDGGIRIRTYERGVEDETLACGTGSIAGALVAAQQWNLPSPIPVHTKGGDTLIIHFELADGLASSLELEGPAAFIYDAELCLE